MPTIEVSGLTKAFRTYKKLPGFGDMKVKILVAVLAKKFGVKPPGWEKHAANWHTVADVDSEETMAEARVVKREMKAKAKADKS